jgi:ribosome maturation factor RimP
VKDLLHQCVKSYDGTQIVAITVEHTEQRLQFRVMGVKVSRVKQGKTLRILMLKARPDCRKACDVIRRLQDYTSLRHFFETEFHCAPT